MKEKLKGMAENRLIVEPTHCGFSRSWRREFAP